VARVGDASPAFPFAYPVLDATGTPKAVLTAAIDLTVLSELYHHARLPENSYVGVTDHQGVRLLYYPAKATTNPIGTSIKTSNWNVASQKQEPGIMTASGSDGTNRILAFNQVRLNANADPYMYVWAGVPEAYILAPANRILKRNLLLMLLAAIGTLFVSWSLGRKTLIAPINQLMDLTNELAKGNLEKRIVQTDRIDEFGKLTGSFHEMAEALSIGQEKLQNSEDRFKKLSGVTFEGIAIHKEGIVIDGNDSLMRLFGYTREEIIGSNAIVVLFPSESHPILSENVSKHIATPYEVMARKKDGTLFPVEIESRNITEGEDHFRVTAVRDITERKQAEANLLKANEIINRSPAVAIQWKNEVDWPVEFVSANIEKLLGYTAQEFLDGKVSYTESIHKDDIERVRHEVSSNSEKQGQTEFTHAPYRLETKDGRVIWVEDSTYIRRDSKGKVIHYEGIVYDITKRKKAEQDRLELEAQLRQKYKMDSVGVMAGGMAHNFNNNLSIILGNIELSKMKMPPDKQVGDYLNNAKIAVLRSRDLIQQIMAYSRQGLQEKAPMQLPLAVDETLLLLRSTIPTTIDVHKSISSDSRNRTVNVDISQVQECLVNLCNNAVHAMKEEGTLRISLETLELTQQDIPPQYESQPGLYAKLSVQDDGSGMPAETLDKIFDLFYTTKPVDEGTGVGLSTVQGIVKQHGGLIKVNSTLGEGSCFELYFPVTEQTQTTETASVNDDQPEGTESILFIDDDEMLANLGKEILTDKGYQVTSMTESTEALKLFSANPDSFKLVITDQTMPALCGKELIQKMLKIRPDMPTIICTGYSSKINEVEARQLGAGAFLMKPLDLPELLQTVRRVLDEKKAS
jgi:PAS domain S-box-containing protein